VARIVVIDYHSIYYQNLYLALTFTMDTDTGEGHLSSLYVELIVVVRNAVLFVVTLYICTWTGISEVPARTAEPAAGIVFTILRLSLAALQRRALSFLLYSH
jgi:hypothetical protein